MTMTDLEKAAREERREYYRKYRAANKEKIKEYNKRYWLKRAKRALEEAQKEGM